MLACFLLLALGQKPTYDFVRIPSPTETQTLSQAVLLEDGTIVANWYDWVAPGHGASMMAVPYVWDGKKTIKLPLGTAEHGHVLFARNGVLVGDLQTSEGVRPAMWSIGADRDWSKAKLTVLDDRDGWAVWIDSEGKVWMNSQGGVASWQKGQVVRKKIANFDLVAVDAAGRMFGNRYSGIGIGFSRNDERAGFFLDDKWKPIFGEESTSRIAALSDSGVAVGARLTDGWKAVSWSKGAMTTLAESKGYASADAVSPIGHIVGIVTTQESWGATVWYNGKATELRNTVPGAVLSRALAVNAKGQVLATSERRDDAMGVKNDLYLLTPKR